MSAKPRPRLQPEWFERLYESDPDPWRFATSEYEHRKYEATLAALPPRRYPAALEVGCSIGVFTEALAARCDSLCAIDVSARALALAGERLAGRPHVELRRAAFPEQVPRSDWDLIVCSEVLYYLDPPALDAGIVLLRSSLAAGGTVVAVHWRAETASYPLRGDEVHDRLSERLSPWHRLDARSTQFRLDVFTQK